MFPFSNGRSLCWNATFTDTYADTNIYSSAVSVRHAAPEAEKQKRRKYGALGTRFRFAPVLVETRGVYGESTAALISEIGRRITEAARERVVRPKA